MQIIIGLVSLSLLIIVHEWGHFLAARRKGVRVLRFAMFLGPTIWRFRRQETLFSVGIIPLGGFCQMKGDLKSLGQEPQKGDYFYASWTARAIITLAGSSFNLLLALLILLLLFSFPHPLAPSYSSKIVLTSSSTGQLDPAAKAGLQNGDQLLAINGQAIATFQDIIDILAKITGEQLLRFDYLRSGEYSSVMVQPLVSNGRPYVGITPWQSTLLQALPKTLLAGKLQNGDRIVSLNGIEVEQTYQFNKLAQQAIDGSTAKVYLQVVRKAAIIEPIELTQEELQSLTKVDYFAKKLWSGFSSPKEALISTVRQIWQILVLVVRTLTTIFDGSKPVGEVLIGPLQISELLGASVLSDDSWAWAWFRWLALLSINLAIMNLLPIPGLDGGTLFFSLLQLLFPAHWQRRAYQIYSVLSWLLLLGLLVLVFSLDAIHYLGQI